MNPVNAQLDIYMLIGRDYDEQEVGVCFSTFDLCLLLHMSF